MPYARGANPVCAGTPTNNNNNNNNNNTAMQDTDQTTASVSGPILDALRLIDPTPAGRTLKDIVTRAVGIEVLRWIMEHDTLDAPAKSIKEDMMMSPKRSSAADTMMTPPPAPKRRRRQQHAGASPKLKLVARQIFAADDANKGKGKGKGDTAVEPMAAESMAAAEPVAVAKDKGQVTISQLDAMLYVARLVVATNRVHRYRKYVSTTKNLPEDAMALDDRSNRLFVIVGDHVLLFAGIIADMIEKTTQVEHEVRRSTSTAAGSDGDWAQYERTHEDAVREMRGGSIVRALMSLGVTLSKFRSTADGKSDAFARALLAMPVETTSRTHGGRLPRVQSVVVVARAKFDAFMRTALKAIVEANSFYDVHNDWHPLPLRDAKKTTGPLAHARVCTPAQHSAGTAASDVGLWQASFEDDVHRALISNKSVAWARSVLQSMFAAAPVDADVDGAEDPKTTPECVATCNAYACIESVLPMATEDIDDDDNDDDTESDNDDDTESDNADDDDDAESGDDDDDGIVIASECDDDDDEQTMSDE